MDEAAAGAIPIPAARLTAPSLHLLQSGTVLHRVHSPDFQGNAFNPCQGGQTRFAPIRDASGVCIPSLYAGDAVDAAIYETLFHDIPLGANRMTVPRSAVENRNHSTLVVRRTLRLANLRAPDLRRWSIDRSALIEGLPTHYNTTALWAKAVHDQFGDVDGLIWTSRLCDPHSSFLLFGDRVRATALDASTVRQGWDRSFLADVRDAANRGNIVITL